MKKMVLVFILLTIPVSLSQVTPPEELPSQKYHLSSDINSFTVEDRWSADIDLILLASHDELKSGISVYRLKLIFTSISNYRLGLNMENLSNKAKIFFSDADQIMFRGPVSFDQEIGPIEFRSGIINSDAIIIELELPDSRLLPSTVIIKNILTEGEIETTRYSINTENLTPIRWEADRPNPKVLLTGYWPPSNEMIRHFSQNPELNLDGWVGGNWENRGYDVVAYFPEFVPPDCNDCGIGYGDLEVDYQNTSEEFWPIAEDVSPLGIITFSRGYGDMSWEIEMNTYNRTNWYADYLTPYLPTPNPPDEISQTNYLRPSTLPVEEIQQAVSDTGLELNAYIDYNGNTGMFVSEFMGYHGVWYQDIHLYSEDPCYASGHIHVGSYLPVNTARSAAEESLRTLLDYLDQFIYIPGDVDGDEVINILDIVIVLNYILGTQDLIYIQFLSADMDQNTIVNVLDIIQIINMIMGN